MKNLILTIAIIIASIFNGFGQDNTIIFKKNNSTKVSYALAYDNDELIYTYSIDDEDTDIYEIISVQFGNIIYTTEVFGVDESNVKRELQNTTTDAIGYYTYDDSDMVLTILTNIEPEQEFVEIKMLDKYNLSTTQTEVSNLNIYPNPVVNDLNISFESNENENVIITDMSGREVYNDYVNSFTKVDFSNQPSGMYFVKIGNTTRKVIKN